VSQTSSALTDRQQAWPAPPPNLDVQRFPARTVPVGRTLYRVHPVDKGCWHFPCISGSRSGRFDTSGPERGTCYTATDPLTALAEKLGYAVLRGPDIAPNALDGLSVSSITTARPYWVVDLTRRTCSILGALGRELSTLTPYTTPQGWARLWEQAGFDGVLYYPRHDAKTTARSIALFGPVEGLREDDWPTPPMASAGDYFDSFARSYGLRPKVPGSEAIVRPPS
jgi:hypothetical protein